ncbi:MAG: hypothetical protein BWY76_02513 [bacterium ADurb.Bin429]|nr:MAG: hypothetical protein BWY76_02513 [bacterium ADurb.Bin429]
MVILVDGLHRVGLFLDERAGEGPCAIGVCAGKRFPQFEARAGDRFRVYVAHPPGNIRSAMQIPHESLETVVQNARALRRPPDDVRLALAVIGAAEEGIKPADVVHVQVRKEEMVNPLNLGKRQPRQHPVAAVKQQPVHRLPGIDMQQQRVIAPRRAEDLMLDAHGGIVPQSGRRACPCRRRSFRREMMASCFVSTGDDSLTRPAIMLFNK